MKRIIIASALFIATSVSAEETLCLKDESVVFSCHIGWKIISLCEKDRGGRSLHYRFGAKTKVELSYPASQGTADSRFTQNTVPMFGGGMTYVNFHRDDFEYRVYSKIGRSDKGGTDDSSRLFEDGVLVLRNGKLVKKLVCDDGGEGFRDSVDWLPQQK